MLGMDIRGREYAQKKRKVSFKAIKRAPDLTEVPRVRE